MSAVRPLTDLCGHETTKANVGLMVDSVYRTRRIDRLNLLPSRTSPRIAVSSVVACRRE